MGHTRPPPRDGALVTAAEIAVSDLDLGINCEKIDEGVKASGVEVWKVKFYYRCNN